MLALFCSIIYKSLAEPSFKEIAKRRRNQANGCTEYTEPSFKKAAETNRGIKRKRKKRRSKTGKADEKRGLIQRLPSVPDTCSQKRDTVRKTERAKPLCSFDAIRKTHN